MLDRPQRSTSTCGALQAPEQPGLQVLVYKQEKLQARLRYLHSIGLSRAQLVAIAAGNPQILSLDIADNLAPKVRPLWQFSIATVKDLRENHSLQKPGNVCSPSALPSPASPSHPGLGIETAPAVLRQGGSLEYMPRPTDQVHAPSLVVAELVGRAPVSSAQPPRDAVLSSGLCRCSTCSRSWEAVQRSWHAAPASS